MQHIGQYSYHMMSRMPRPNLLKRKQYLIDQLGESTWNTIDCADIFQNDLFNESIVFHVLSPSWSIRYCLRLSRSWRGIREIMCQLYWPMCCIVCPFKDVGGWRSVAAAPW